MPDEPAGPDYPYDGRDGLGNTLDAYADIPHVSESEGPSFMSMFGGEPAEPTDLEIRQFAVVQAVTYAAHRDSIIPPADIVAYAEVIYDFTNKGVPSSG